jgi:hypothetical protein
MGFSKVSHTTFLQAKTEKPEKYSSGSKNFAWARFGLKIRLSSRASVLCAARDLGEPRDASRTLRRDNRVSGSLPYCRPPDTHHELATRGISQIRIRACLQACRKRCVMRAPLGAEVGDLTFTTGC